MSKPAGISDPGYNGRKPSSFRELGQKNKSRHAVKRGG
jgi:hypothetical protein